MKKKSYIVPNLRVFGLTAENMIAASGINIDEGGVSSDEVIQRSNKWDVPWTENEDSDWE